ncbi:RCC1 domain-containing protein [Paracholeplasma manati]|uniref:RCC1 domain-containing protein n=1 Tax=Paracholeplasma manati TaxID=591373 RepID=UPI0024081D6A|nr:InlB B-repeat-containing protein [Paracholeplasma manati]MDG0888296.1 InlB B-repeat-containing protein [Paracholeplasma manati]
MRRFGLVLATLLLTITLYACNVSTVKITISFDSNGGTAVNSITYDGVSSITIPEDPMKEGFVFSGWYWDNGTFRDLFSIDSLTERGISSNLTVYAKWVEDQDYIPIGSVNVTFVSNGGTEVEPVYVLPGRTIVIPSTTREGYTLEGWYTSLNDGVTFDEKWSFTTNFVNNNLSLYAKWNINQYTITFNSNSGSNVPSITQDFDSLVIEPSIPSREGYTFDGWFEDSNLTESYTFSKMSSNNITLYAKWTINDYTVFYEENGGSVVSDLTVDFGTTLTAPNQPSKDGYTFSGWFSDIELTKAYLFNTMPASNVTLYAKWELNTYVISYDLNGGEAVANPIEYTIESDTINLISTSKEGYSFVGWFVNPELAGVAVNSITQGTMGNINLYASFEKNQYSITYNIFSNDYNSISDISLNAGETLENITLGYNNSAIITSNGRVFTWGNGQKTPVEITSSFDLRNDEKIIQVSLGGNHSAAITSSGRLFTWGSNNYGQLGDGTNNNSDKPIDITLITRQNFVWVALGQNHSAAITVTGHLYTWGFNQYGRLGDGTFTDRNKPVYIGFDLNPGEQISKVYLGYAHTAAITTLGRIFTWGINNYGQLGGSTNPTRNTPYNITSEFKLNEGEKIKEVSLGYSHSSAITSTGRIFSWGRNDQGQLGDGLFTNSSSPKEITSKFNLYPGEVVSKVSFGTSHSSAITSNGRLFMWGKNDQGQLGNSLTINSSIPIDITMNFNLNTDEYISKSALGDSFSSVMTTKGRIFTWGKNLIGQLGDGSTVSRNFPFLLNISTADLDSIIQYYFDENLDYIPVLEGYAFDGWYIDITLLSKYNITKMPSQNIILYGKWVKN